MGENEVGKNHGRGDTGGEEKRQRDLTVQGVGNTFWFLGGFLGVSRSRLDLGLGLCFLEKSLLFGFRSE